MKIYLAGPMRGLPDYNFPEFLRYAHKLRAQGHEVFNPAEIGIEQDNIRAIFAVEMDWICREAEAVALLPGWSQSRGAIAERALAEALGLEVACLLKPEHENPSPSEPLFSITFPSPLRKSPKSPSPDSYSTKLRVGIARSLWTSPTLLFVTILIAVPLTGMGLGILLRWLGVL